MRYRAAWIGAIAAIGPLMGPALAKTTQIGEVVPNFEFKDIRYLQRTLSDLSNHKGFALVFLNTDCPISRRYLPRLRELDACYTEKDIQFVGVFCSAEDTVMEMASFAIENELRFPVVKDEGSEACAALGIDRVPQVAVLDAGHRLVYRGRINDQYRVSGTQPNASRQDLATALDELLAGKPVTVKETPVDGCKVTPPRDPKFDETPTFHGEVAAILQQRCQRCHHAGTPAPFALTTYEEVKDHAEMVAEVVRDQRMPPWYANAKYGHFINAPGMTADERNKIVAWINADCPAGDPARGPAPLVFANTEWRIGEPDLKITMRAPDKIQAEGFIPYKYVILPHVFQEDTYVSAIEIRPHNCNVVHHCNLAYVNVANMKGGDDTFITGYVPGGQPMDLRPKTASDPEVAYQIPKGSSLVLQIHYVTTGKEEQSLISVGFRYPKKGVDKLSHHFVLDARGIAIAPRDPMWRLSATKTIPANATLLGMFTHMHVRGRDMTFIAEYPDGQRQTLLQIPNYNFEWQLAYECRNRLPAGTKIEAVAHYDNSRFNVYNPDPERKVPYGAQTFDEMFNGFVFWTNDDENLKRTVDPKTGHAVTDHEQPAKR
jgi:peroxiredoxin